MTTNKPKEWEQETGELVRDLTAVGFPSSKSAVRRRLINLLEKAEARGRQARVDYILKVYKSWPKNDPDYGTFEEWLTTLSQLKKGKDEL